MSTDVFEIFTCDAGDQQAPNNKCKKEARVPTVSRGAGGPPPKHWYVFHIDRWAPEGSEKHVTAYLCPACAPGVKLLPLVNAMEDIGRHVPPDKDLSAVVKRSEGDDVTFPAAVDHPEGVIRIEGAARPDPNEPIKYIGDGDEDLIDA